ncbi:MAG: hypothetical protein PHY08_12245 [Candidatus Cloacimonetes bacterium]|nr:hypothetical protein [Candidatus Cloacimonadota bacterium]
MNGGLKMYKEYNAHPKGLKTTDCVVRAIATATNSDYLETRRELNRRKRELGYTSYKDTKFLYDYFKGYPRLNFKPVKGCLELKVVILPNYIQRELISSKWLDTLQFVLMELYWILGIAATVQLIRHGKYYIIKYLLICRLNVLRLV